MTILFILLTFNSIVLTACNEYDGDYGRIENLVGINKIDDGIFRSFLITYLTYDSKLDYENIYYCLSEGYLKKYFPNVNNANEYKVYKQNYSERKEPEYLEIISWNKIEEDYYYVDLVSKTNAEGILIKITERYFFVKTDNQWKYDGLKRIDSKPIEE